MFGGLDRVMVFGSSGFLSLVTARDVGGSTAEVAEVSMSMPLRILSRSLSLLLSL